MKTPTTAPRARLELDRLEDRTTPSASVVGGNLVIEGTTGNDNVLVVKVKVGGVDNFRVREGTTVTNFVASTVTGNVQFNGGDGNDRFVNLTALPTIANGGAGNDVLIGGFGFDTLDGGDGNDWLSAGLDTKGSKITGGLGSDKIFGSRGDDVIIAGTGGATEGDTSTNFVFGLAGKDTITGGAGVDYIFGGAGDDTIDGGAGNDFLHGNQGADTINGGDGDDHIDGGVFDGAVDTLTGGAGADTFSYNPLWNFNIGTKDTFVDFTAGTDKRGGLFSF